MPSSPTANLVTFVDLQPWERIFVRKHFPIKQLRLTTRGIKVLPPNILRRTMILSDFVQTPIQATQLAAMPNLRLIATRSTGYDHIDVSACLQKGIRVANVPTYGTTTVAEYTFALLLSLSRRIHQTHQYVQHGGWTREEICGFDLAGKTLGVIGCGNIGAHVVRIARGFDMRVLAYDPHHSAKDIRRIGALPAALRTLIRQSDIVTLHVPLTAATRHLLRRKNLAHCKRGATLINTARGGLIETAALVWAVSTGRIRYAGLDVLEEEDAVFPKMRDGRKPLNAAERRLVQQNRILMRHPRVLITPHNAFNTQEARERILSTTIDNIQAFLTGKPKNIV